MIYIFSIFIITTLLAYYGEKKLINIGYDQKGKPYRFKRYRVNSFAFISMLIIFILFVGLRTSYNDTTAYIVGYERLSVGLEAIRDINWGLGSNPGFQLSNTLLKTFVSENAQVMLFIWALITIVLFFRFYRRWSERFWLTVFLYTASGTLLFSMAALKQVLAMGIGLYGITCLLRHQRTAFIICILIGSTIHTYLLLYLVAFFLMDRLWSGKMVSIVIGAVLSGVFIEYFVRFAYSTTELLGSEYAEFDALSGQGLSIYRFMVYSIVPMLTWIYRKKINMSGNVALILFSNLTLIGWCFMLIALFSNGNMFGRMGMYFDPFMHLTLTALLVCILPQKNRNEIILACVISYVLYFSYQIYEADFAYRWALH